jgi:predicted aspartyl protease
VRVRWERRPRGFIPAQGGIAHEVRGGALRVRGAVALGIQPLPNPEYRLSLGELRVQAAHALGYALGLSDCSRCDSILSLGWRAQEISEPTALDVASLQALLAKQSGTRSDGRPLAGLPGSATPDVALASAGRAMGVLADLPFLNMGREGPVLIDLARPDDPSFVVELDTGANDTVLTTDYARALGVSVRSVKTDPYRRPTITGRTLSFWVMGQRVVGGGVGPTHFDYALLGGEFLREFVLDLDYPRRRVRFLDPAHHRIGDVPGEAVVPLQINGTHPYAEVRAGSGSVWALVDTGAEGPLLTTEEKARALGIAVDRSAARTGHRNVLGTQVSVVQSLGRATLGPVELRDVGLEIAIGDESSVRVGRWLQDETLIGSDVLRDFRVRFDYKRRQMGLTRGQ